MTPKEKAKELVDKMARADGYLDSIDLSTATEAKSCAIIAVDEIIEVLHDIGWETGWPNETETINNFWHEVKQEIETGKRNFVELLPKN